ncbi:FMRFamide receptor-like [Lineus longissimus]|uniref:FMRFamide receptor-like n=1 Tax=Lineus longissimus TaxID=88925 RepID=UPI00315D3106
MLLCVLALVDTARLCTYSSRFSVAISGVSLLSLTKASCPLFIFSTYSIKYFASWTIVMITIERVICVVYPLKARVLCTKKSTAIAIFSMFAFFSLLNSHILKYARIQDSGNCRLSTTPRFGLYENYNDFWNKLWLRVDLCIYSVIPFTAILICNCILIKKVRKSQSKQKELQTRMTSDDEASESRMISMTRMLITVSLTFILLTLPTSIYFVARGMIVIQSKEQSYALQLAYAITTMISLVNHSINFLLYCLSGTQFRREVYLMFKGQKRP